MGRESRAANWGDLQFGIAGPIRAHVSCPVALASASRAHRFFRPAHHEIDIPTPTPGANQPLAPFEDWGIKVVPLGKLGGIGFDLMIAFPDTTR